MPFLIPGRRRLSRLAYRLSGWPRRLVALALLAAAAVTAGAASHRSVAPTVPPVPVLAAARDLPVGAALSPADLRTVRLPPAAVPTGALRPGARLAHRRLAAPVRAGEPLTDIRLTGPGLTAALAGTGRVAVPIRLADADLAALLRPGDRVDVISPIGTAGGPNARSPTVLVRDATVLLVPRPDPESTLDGALAVVAVAENLASRLAAVTTSTPVAVTLPAAR